MTTDGNGVINASERRETGMKMASIGLPVFNGGRYLRGALDSLLDQSYGNIELIVSDNASSDDTEDICRSYAEKDARVRYYRSVCNEGPARNFRSVLDLARGEFFMWAAHDDEWCSEYVAENVSAIESNEGVVASVSRVTMIPDDGRGERYIGTFPLMGAREENVEKFLSMPGHCSRFYGVYRTEVIRKCMTREGDAVWAGDWLVVVRVLRYGKFFEVDKQLLRRRNNAISGAGRSRTIRQVINGWTGRVLPLLPFTVQVLSEPHVPKSRSVIVSLIRYNLGHCLESVCSLLRSSRGAR